MSDIIIPRQARSFCQTGQRETQQDARFPDEDTPREGQRTFVVCDGVGGQTDGDIASATVCRAFADFLNGYADPAYEFTQGAFREAISFAYQRLLGAIGDRESDMATTLTFLHLNARNAMIAHMGDSRVYQIRPGMGIMYRTNDHSLVNALVHAGEITPAQAIDHPEGNVITRCMCYVEPGAEPTPADVIVLTDIEPGDYFLLCTDGVLHQIDDQYLVDLFSSDYSDDEKLRSLAELSADSSDNNTAIFVGIADAPPVPSPLETLEPNEEVEHVAPRSMPTCEITETEPEIAPVSPDNSLPLGKKIASRLRTIFG